MNYKEFSNSELDCEMQALFSLKQAILANVDKINNRIIEINEEKLRRKNMETDVTFFDDV
jgi:hypothetical protein